MGLHALLGQTAEIRKNILRDLRWEGEREFVIVVHAAEIRNVESMLP